MNQFYALYISSLKRAKSLYAFVILLTVSVASVGQVSLTTIPQSYGEDFNSYLGSAASLPTGWTTTFNGALTYAGVDNGGSNTGGAKALGTGGEYCLGALRSGSSLPGITYTVTFTNNTGSTITSLVISWDYEQWRYAGNTTGLDCSATGVLAGNATINSKDFVGAASGSSGTVTVTPVTSFTLTGLSITNGSTFGLSFATTDASGADNGIGVDNFSLTIPTPCTSPSITTNPAAGPQLACQGSTPTNLSVVINAGATSPTYQWYSNTVNNNTTGSSISGATSNTYTPPTAVLGTVYYYCIVSGCSVSVTSTTGAVTVSAPPSASISYPNTPFCSNAGIQTVIRTGSASGSYPAVAGLSINGSTGDIDPALSTAGTYTVTYSMPAAGGCAIQTATTSITVTALPAATISYPAASFCKTAGVQTVTRTGTAGGTYTVLPSGLTINSSTGAITPSSSTEGDYTVTYTMTAPGFGCTVNQTTTTTVSIRSTATSIAPTAIQDLSVNNDGNTLTVTEGDVTVTRQWKYGVTPGGPYPTNLGTGTTETPNFSSLGTFYIVCETTYPATPCGVATVRSNEVQINVTNNAVITTAATYGPFCNNTTNPITVDFTYSPAINFTAGVTVFTAQLSDASGSFASPTNIGTVISDASGSQTIAATIPSAIPGGTGFRVRIRSASPNSIGTDNGNDFIVGGFPSATISYPGAPYCSTAGVQTVNLTGTTGGNYSSTAGLTIDPSTGAITPSTSTPGTYIITYSMPVVGTCPAQTTTTSVTITASPAAVISYPTSPFCSNGGVQTVTRTGTAGGAYSSTAGLSINSSTGAITPLSSTAGTYVVSYTIAAAGGCALHTDATSITITQAPAAVISYAGTPFCSNDFSVKTVTRTGTTGGTYTASPAGLTINASTGDISIFSSTPGTYTVTYSMNSVGGCPVQTATTSVTINTAPTVLDITGTTTINTSSSTTLADATPSGVWTSSNTAVATVNASGLVTSTATAGTTIIRYTVTSGGCSTAASTAVNVINAAGVALWDNPINDLGNPSATNPYTGGGQTVNGNVSVSGIGFPTGSGLASTAATNRYNLSGWVDAAINTSKYFSFTMTADAGYAIDFTSFVYAGQASGTGPISIEIRSSVDGYSSAIGTPTIAGTTISLTAAAYQNITSPITFRVYLWGASSAGGTYGIQNFTFYGNMRILCGSPTAIEIVTQPTFVAQDNVMSPVLVRAKCADGTTGAGYTGSVVLSVFNGCGYTTQTVNAVGGIATFNNIIFRRSAQSDVRLNAFAAGFASVQSDTFSVTAPAGVAATTTIASENFEAASTWAYTAGSDVVVGSGGSAGTGVVTVKTFSGNKVLVKSYSANNASGERGSTNTITFANQTIPGTYSSAKFNFQLASLSSSVAIGDGGGNDNGENMLIEISLDGGSVWDKLLTYYGNSNYLFNLSAAPVENLAYNANASYLYPSTQSAFSVSLPSSATQFRFRITATNNRTFENWSIDNISLVGTAVAGAGVINPLPTVTNDNIIACPSSNTTLTLVTGNTIGVVSYVWTPATNLNNSTISNPVANPSAAQVYTAVITDADGCKATGTYTITNPGGTTGTWYGYNNSDWFQCGNWGGGVVPTSGTTVTIPNAATNIAEIDPLSSYAAAFSGIANANNITVDNKTLRTQANAVLTLAGNLTIQNSGTLDMTNGGQVNLSGSWSKTTGGIFTSGIGTVNYAGNAVQTIAAENYYNLTSSSSGNRTMPAGTVGVAGTFTKGANTYSFTSGNIVDYNGGTSQTIAPFTAGAVTGATYDNLTLSNTGTKSLSGNTDVESDLTLSNTIQLALGSNFLTLKSTVGKTARVAPVSATATISYGTGKFVIERYFPGNRAWRLITAPVTVDATKTFFNSWQAGGNNSLANGGNGTYVTGPGETAGNGLDVSPQHNYSLKSFNQATSSYDGIGDTKGTNLISGVAGVAGTPDNVGYFMFVRGDRTTNNPQPFNPSVIGNATTLRDTGKIQIQNYVFNCNPTVGTHSYTLIGNPYASPVDFASLSRNGIANKFWAWDPNLNGAQGVGGYAIVDFTSGLSITVPVGGGSTTQTQIIQSKQAFLVQTTGASPTLTFGEAAKSAANNLSLFRPVAPASSLIANLYVVNADGSDNLADGVLAQYNDSYAMGEDPMDAVKFTNVNETFSIKNGNKYYMLERRPFVQSSDTIFFSLNRTRQFHYRFNIKLNNILRQRNRIAYLEDRYLKTATPLNMNGSTWVDFNVNANAASAAANRFFITFKRITRFNNINANVASTDVVVNWDNDSEAAIDRYEVERSSDGANFIKVAETTAKESKDVLNNYSSTDIDPAPGIYYYRIKAISSEYDVFDYSDAVKIKVAKDKSGMYIYPNPVTNNTIGLKMNTAMSEGAYGVRLLTPGGQVMMNTKLQHTKAASTESISYPAYITNGTYQLEVTGPDKKKTVINIVIANK